VFGASVPQSAQMDEATSRTRTSARRMATAKPATTTRRNNTGKSTRKGAEPEISPARWAGVALVIAAIVGAIVLAVISPSDPERSEPGAVPPVGATPRPDASPVGGAVPTERVSIVIPIPAVTSEVDIEVTVDVPKAELAREQLFVVILRNGVSVAEEPKRKATGKQVVPGVRLLEGANELTAALRGPGGLGPLSEPVLMMVDRDAPKLGITSPKNGATTFEDLIEIAGTSEPGAEVRIRNSTAVSDETIVVGPNGTYQQLVPLKKGTNKIVVTSTDAAGMDQKEKISVERLDGKPVIKLTAPKELQRSLLPREIKVSVQVTDSAGESIEGATVSYTLGGPARLTETFEDETNIRGRSSWNVTVTPGGPALDPVQVQVEVAAPHGKAQSSREIRIS